MVKGVRVRGSFLCGTFRTKPRFETEAQSMETPIKKNKIAIMDKSNLTTNRFW